MHFFIEKISLLLNDTLFCKRPVHIYLHARELFMFLFSVLCLLCLCARLFIHVCALWSPAGKGLTFWLSFVVSTVSLSLSHWYPGSGVVLDCIDS